MAVVPASSCKPTARGLLRRSSPRPRRRRSRSNTSNGSTRIGMPFVTAIRAPNVRPSSSAARRVDGPPARRPDDVVFRHWRAILEQEGHRHVRRGRLRIRQQDEGVGLVLAAVAAFGRDPTSSRVRGSLDCCALHPTAPPCPASTSTARSRWRPSDVIVVAKAACFSRRSCVRQVCVPLFLLKCGKICANTSGDSGSSGACASALPASARQIPIAIGADRRMERKRRMCMRGASVRATISTGVIPVEIIEPRGNAAADRQR